MFLRRFSTYSQRLALPRARPASRTAAKPGASAAPAAQQARPSPLRTAKPANATGASPSSAMANGAASKVGASSPEFSPRLVPELKTGPSSTPVSETTDPTEVVRNIPELEQSESLGEDWTTSFQGLGSKPFEPRIIDILLAPVVPENVEVTPDGLIYLPEIKYRRILNRAFGPGGWGIAPRTKTLVTQRQVTREYGLVCLGRLVSVSRGEMDYFNAEGVTTAMEGCKSNALMRCCKDLGIASELWDPTFIRQFKQKHCDTKYYEKKRRFVWKRKDRAWEYPYNQ